MKAKLFLTILSLLVLISISVNAQEITGLWEITEVRVGNEIMTPVAKWTKINKDNTYQNGNGWHQNSEGVWKYDEKTRSFQPEETHGIGIEDKAGPFTVSFKNKGMVWEREEEGSKVTVLLRRISRLPLSPADQLTGLWDLAEVKKGGQIVTPAFDPENKNYLFIRWDRTFMERTTLDEQSYGIWHMDGHKPEMTFIRNDSANEVWQVSLNKAELKMKGISGTNRDVEMIYTRIDNFPNN